MCTVTISKKLLHLQNHKMAAHFQLYFKISQFQELGITLILQGKRSIGLHTSNKTSDSAIIYF